MLASADPETLDTRASLIHGVMVAELERSAETGRISETLRVRMLRRGFDVLGVMAWTMLRAQRTILIIEDFEQVESELGLSVEVMDELHLALERLGFIEVVNFESWEFSHKVFAEHCAARAIARGMAQWQPLLPAIGEPGVNEILVHLGVRPEFTTTIITAVLAETERPFTGLRLAARIAA
jgi:hypothetical protein